MGTVPMAEPEEAVPVGGSVARLEAGTERESALAAVFPAPVEFQVERSVPRAVFAAPEVLTELPVTPAALLGLAAGHRVVGAERPGLAAAWSAGFRDPAAVWLAEFRGLKVVWLAVYPVRCLDCRSNRPLLRKLRMDERVCVPHQRCWPHVGMLQALQHLPADAGAPEGDPAEVQQVSKELCCARSQRGRLLLPDRLVPRRALHLARARHVVASAVRPAPDAEAADCAASRASVDVGMTVLGVSLRP